MDKITSIADIPRTERAALWGRAEEIQRMNPHMTASAAFFHSMKEYETGQHRVEEAFLNALRDNPGSLFKA